MGAAADATTGVAAGFWADAVCSVAGDLPFAVSAACFDCGLFGFFTEPEKSEIKPMACRHFFSGSGLRAGAVYMLVRASEDVCLSTWAAQRNRGVTTLGGTG